MFFFDLFSEMKIDDKTHLREKSWKSIFDILEDWEWTIFLRISIWSTTKPVHNKHNYFVTIVYRQIQVKKKQVVGHIVKFMLSL